MEKTVDEQILYDEMKRAIKDLFAEKLKIRGIKAPESPEETEALTDDQKSVLRAARAEIRGNIAEIFFNELNTYVRPGWVNKDADQGEDKD